MLAVVDHLAVDFVGQNDRVVLLGKLGHRFEVAPGQDAAGRVRRGIQDDELGLVGDESRQLVDVESELLRLAQGRRDRLRADEVDHRFIDWEARVRIDDFVARLAERDDREVHDRLRAGSHDDLLRRDLNAARLGDVGGDGLPQLRNAGRGRVMRLATA